MVKILQLIMQIYKQIGMTLLYLSFLVIFQLWICLQKSTFIKVYIFFWWKFSIKLSWLQRIDNKINIIYVYHFFDPNLWLRYPWKRQDNNRKRGRWNGRLGRLCKLVFGFQENFMQSLSTFILFFSWERKKWFLKAIFSFIPWLFNSPDLLSYGSE